MKDTAAEPWSERDWRTTNFSKVPNDRCAVVLKHVDGSRASDVTARPKIAGQKYSCAWRATTSPHRMSPEARASPSGFSVVPSGGLEPAGKYRGSRGTKRPLIASSHTTSASDVPRPAAAATLSMNVSLVTAPHFDRDMHFQKCVKTLPAAATSSTALARAAFRSATSSSFRTASVPRCRESCRRLAASTSRRGIINVPTASSPPLIEATRDATVSSSANLAIGGL
mmetsp:Transcript_21847/g.67251  ORF Transcript_21847/g.67251 Transcript_21847/m.67251 type:complete len:226 (+) Transcript_21847:2073-2750(+)